MTIKPAGKIAIVVVVVVGAFFLLKPMITGKEKQPVKTEVKADSVAPVSDTLEIPKNVHKAPPVVEEKPKVVPKKEPAAKKPVKKKKDGSRENLEIQF